MGSSPTRPTKFEVYVDIHDQKTKELLDPILAVFGGEDGGVAFTKLRHGFLPDILRKAEEGSYAEHNLAVMVSQFSRLCEVMLNHRYS